MRWTNPFVCLRKALYRFRIEPPLSHVNRHALVVERWDYHTVFEPANVELWDYHTVFVAASVELVELWDTPQVLVPASASLWPARGGATHEVLWPVQHTSDSTGRH
jgi:hypothetical protein